MLFHGIDIVCPACTEELEADGDSALRCVACARSFPVLLGIPDFRLWPDPYIGLEDDREKALKLASACAGLSFPESVVQYYRMTTVVPPFQAAAFSRALLAARGRAAHSLARWERSAPADTHDLDLLEIGCGTAPLLVDAATRYRTVAGVDIAFRWLVLAKKRLEEAGVDAPLFCACAEALPFRDTTFNRLIADSAVEHFRDQTLAAKQMARVMRPGARLFVVTPNRFSLGPDPHVGTWAGGWLPERWLADRARARGAIPPHRKLLSARALRALLQNAGFEDVHISVPDVPDSQRAGFGVLLRSAIAGYNLMVRTPPGRAVLLRLGPLLEAAARRPAGVATQ